MNLEERREDKSSKMPQGITLILTAMISIIVWLLFRDAIPEENREIALVILGGVSAKWHDSLGFWINSSSSSSQKNKLLARKG